MARRESADIRHTQVTDHRILRNGSKPGADEPATGALELVPFGGGHSEPRDLGLAYAQVALQGDAHAAQEAVRLLQDALPRYPRDVEVLTRLGFLYQEDGEDSRASKLYEDALEVDPDDAVAASNLAEIYATRGQLAKALPLWTRTFSENPGLSEVGVDLSIALCRLHDPARACATLLTVLKHNPDMGPARAMLRELEKVPGECPAD
jgi:tetratricopeptide (TPR) repeat protein